MTRSLRRVKPPSTRLMRWILRLRQSGARWSIRRLTMAMQRAEQTLVLLMRMVDSQLVLLKELEEKLLLAQNRLQELSESRAFRERGELPPAPEESPEELDRLLGM